MDVNSIQYTSSLDILFNGRNKAYGAYLLRKSYNKRLKIALGCTSLLVLLFVGSTMIPQKKQLPQKVLVGPTVHLEKFKEPAKPKQKLVPPPPPAPVPPKIEMRQFTVPIVVPDELVKPDLNPPKQTERITVGPVTQHGLKMEDGLAAPPEVRGVGGNGKMGVGGAGENLDYEKEFIHVEVEAMYPGGQQAWKKYLERNLRSETPIDMGAAPGTYTVVVSFLVAKDGSTSEIKVLSAPDPDYGTSQEAIRVIERSGKWQPAIQNGRSVIFREKQKIIFQVN